MAASDYVWALVSGLPKREREGRLLAIFQAAIDDSRDQNAFVLGGFVAEATAFAALSDEWDALCQTPPTIRYFKMAEAMGLAGEFYGWPEEDRNKKVRSFIEIIKRYVEFGTFSVVNVPAYQSIVLKDYDFRPFKTPYFLCALGLLGHAPAHKHLHGKKIDFIFDEQFHESDDLLAVWTDFTKAAPVEFQEFYSDRPVYKNDQVFKPLQAADLFAWLVRRVYSEKIATRSNYQHEFIDFLGELKVTHMVWSPYTLQEYVRFVGPIFKPTLNGKQAGKFRKFIAKNPEIFGPYKWPIEKK